MRTDAPGGEQIELHRRCWIGRGGATPAGCVRVTASALGYASDLDFVFPIGCGVFPGRRRLSVPSRRRLVAGVGHSSPDRASEKRISSAHRASPVVATGLPEAVTNRIFSIGLALAEKQLAFGATGLPVRPLLMSAGRQVGAAGMAIDAELDRDTGCVTLQPGKAATVAFLLNDESVSSLRVVVQDPATDAELYRSSTDIPVRLGV